MAIRADGQRAPTSPGHAAPAPRPTHRHLTEYTSSYMIPSKQIRIVGMGHSPS
ncbi:unnamed protein product, partial [marine sediment metagenome]